MAGHSGTVNSIAISPDGKRVVSGSDDNLVKIWNAETGAEVSSHGGRSAWVGLPRDKAMVLGVGTF